MVNAFGYYASSKGMVLVPNLSGLSSSAAISSLTASGLNYSLGSDVNTSNQALDNLVATQDPAQNTLVDYETVVQFSLYNFVGTTTTTPTPPTTTTTLPPTTGTTAPPTTGTTAPPTTGTTPTPTTTTTTTTTLSPTTAYATFCSAGQAYAVGQGLNFTNCGDLQNFVFANYDGPITDYTCQIGSMPPLPNCTPASTTTTTTTTTTTAGPTIYSVTYDCNGGSGCPANTTHTGSYTIPSTIPTRSGFTFGGYQVTCSGSFIGDYSVGSTVSCSGNLVLTARWTATTTTTTTTTTTAAPTVYWYTGCCSTTGSQVTGTSTVGFTQAFNAMNAQCSGSVTNQQSGVGGTIPTLSCPQPATTTTSAPTSAPTTSAPTSAPTTSAPTSAPTTSGPTTYSVTYDCAGGTGCASNTTHTGSHTVSGPTPSRAGYDFQGYNVFCSNSFIGAYNIGQTVSCAGNLRLEARWSARTCGGAPEPIPGECFCQAGTWLC